MNLVNGNFININMKTSIVGIIFFLWFPNIGIGQRNVNIDDFKYRRSSLHRVLINSKSMPDRDKILDYYFNAPFPDKYNDHTIDTKLIDVNMVSGAGKKMGVSNSIKNAFDILDELDKQKVAHKLVAKWFNRKQDGSFDIKLIAERGYYNATQMEASIAAGTVRGITSLADAGEELIKNTFVVVSQLEFTENSNALGDIINIVSLDESTNKSLSLIAKSVQGYYVGAPTYLFQLQWNDDIANEFYETLWVDANNPDEVRANAFWDSYLFSMKLVGVQTDRTLVAGLQENTDTYIKQATIRTLDKVYAKLQKNYSVFKPRVPLLSIDPFTAEIGMKEGLVGNEKFEVLEQQVDKKTGLTVYVNKGTLSVDKNKIWDNRYSVVDSGLQNRTTDVTHFTGKVKKPYPGMLLKQIK